MADKNWRTGNDLIENVPGEACTFDFFRLIRRLELAFPNLPLIGKSSSPADEIMRIRPEASFRFPPSAISSIEACNEENKLLIITITFFGLYGRYGTLPWHYTSRIIHQERPSITEMRNPQSALRPFLDIFNHRFATFFYRSGIKYRWPLTFRKNGQDEVSRNFVAFLGLRTLHVSNRFNIPDCYLLRYAGLFTVPNSASALTSLLSDFLNTRVQIRQFEGEWLDIEDVDRNRIGSQRKNNCLAHSFTLGRRIFSRQHRFRIEIDPVSYDLFLLLKPDGKKFNELVTLVKMRAGISMKFDCAIKVKRETVPQAVAGRNKTRLGSTFFLLSSNKTGHVNCPVFKSDKITQRACKTFETEGADSRGRNEYV